MFIEMPPDYCRAVVNTGEYRAAERWQEELVLRAIGEILEALSTWRKKEADPSATEEDRQRARQAVAWREREFGGQWVNVEQILKRAAEAAGEKQCR